MDKNDPGKTTYMIMMFLCQVNIALEFLYIYFKFLFKHGSLQSWS